MDAPRLDARGFAHSNPSTPRMDATTRLELALALYPRLDSRAHACALFLLRHANAVGEWRGDFGQVAQALGVSWSTVARGFSSLLSSGVINKGCSNGKQTTWVVLWQNCYGTCYGRTAMADPPHPPPSGARISPPPNPSRASRSDTWTKGGGGGKEARSFGDLQDAPDSATAEETRSLLAEVRNVQRREAIVERCSPELVRFALRCAADATKSPHSKISDPVGFAVHLLTSGSAKAQRDQESQRREQRERTAAERLTVARASIEGERDEAHERERSRGVIDQATDDQVAKALSEAVEEFGPLAGRWRKSIEQMKSPEELRKLARSPIFALAVSTRLLNLNPGESTHA